MNGESGSEDQLFTAKDLQRWRWQMGSAPGVQPPGAAIFCLQPYLLEHARRRFPLKPVKGLFGDCFLLKNTRGRVALVGGFGLGAPVMAILVEEYSAFGVHRLLSVGMAGSLQPNLHAGEIVVCTGAVRGESTSAHYLPPSARVEADEEMVLGICDHLSYRGIPFITGPSWTTDAPYRETRREADAYRRQGILTVEMEAAALYASARSLGIQAASVFVIADRLLPGGWEPPEKMVEIQEKLSDILDAAVSWLAGAGR